MRASCLLGIAGLLLGAAAPIQAQCVMCRTAAAAAQAHAAGTINAAILILLLPAVTLFGGVFLLVFRGAPPAAIEAGGDQSTESGGVDAYHAARSRD